jgi:DIS3-like exonuclease 2
MHRFETIFRIRSRLHSSQKLPLVRAALALHDRMQSTICTLMTNVLHTCNPVTLLRCSENTGLFSWLGMLRIGIQLDKSDGQTPLLAAPYPIRDSNRLVEEFMLLANYLVAQRLITHAGGRPLLRNHPEPLDDGLDDVAAVAKAGIGFDLDITTSATLHASLNRLARECNDPLVLLSVTQMLMNPMRPAVYIAAGLMESELWRHFALNIPYYTHFTSPIRRYPDVMVHRLLQATIDGEKAIQGYPLTTMSPVSPPPST